MSDQSNWWTLAASLVAVRAIKMSVVVGSLLALINHGDAIYQGGVSTIRFVEIRITYCVPYLVSTISSVSAIQEFHRKRLKESGCND